MRHLPCLPRAWCSVRQALGFDSESSLIAQAADMCAATDLPACVPPAVLRFAFLRLQCPQRPVQRGQEGSAAAHRAVIQATVTRDSSDCGTVAKLQ